MLWSIFATLFKSPQPARRLTKIDRWLVLSWTVTSIGYDAERKILQVEYSNGFIYEADGVSQEEWNHLKNATNFAVTFRDTILARYQLHKVGILHPVFLG